MIEEKEMVEEESSVEDDEVSDEVSEEVSVEDESRFAFAMAPVVRVMKDELDKDKMIRSKVKEEMNLWLEKVCRKVSQQMNKSEYTMVELDDFKTAIEPYEMIDDVEQERYRIVATMEKIKQDCDSLIRDVNRKFITYTFPESKTEEGVDESGIE
ncbi:MAG: hypothetical protein U9Q22_08365 [Candidatus Altiarchaeota archaeon]|nr:hypothetical protein [Candidatus Altiarchaeota archaeon]